MSLNTEAELLRLRDRDPAIRKEAACTLGRQRDTRAIPALFLLLKDHDYSVRAAAIRALGDIGDISCVPGILRYLKSGHSDVCREAAYALNRMGSQSSLPHQVLAETSFTPEQRMQTLNELHRIDKGNFYVTVSYPIPDIREFCRQAATSADPAVAEGARSILTYLDNVQTLLRASQRDDSVSSHELLRAAGPTPSGQSETLLRPSMNDPAEQ